MNTLSRWLGWLTGAGGLRKGAAAVVDSAFREPEQGDVAWLAAVSSEADEDHARWELRYARRSLFYHAARRDSLDDSTPAAVARALEEALAADPNVDAAKREIANQQLNARIRAYGSALDDHDERPVTERLGRLLLSYAGVNFPTADQVRMGGGILVRILREANADLRNAFGRASLPQATESASTEILGR